MGPDGPHHTRVEVGEECSGATAILKEPATDPHAGLCGDTSGNVCSKKEGTSMVVTSRVDDGADVMA
eukprot:18946-Eustigmatos_ZCMA.PRE.1